MPKYLRKSLILCQLFAFVTLTLKYNLRYIVILFQQHYIVQRISKEEA